MPLIAPTPPVEQAGARVYRLQGLPDFNTNAMLTVSAFEGFRDAPVPGTVLVGRGGAEGAADPGDWEDAEAYYVLTGLIRCTDRAQMLELRSALLAALPSKHQVPLQVLDAAGGLDLQVFVRRYDKPTITFAGFNIRFSIPLVGPDPRKYALEPVSGVVGVFTGQTWYRNYTPPTRRYQLVGGRWVRRYQLAEPLGPYPPSMTLTSRGDADSRRVRATIVGPLTAGDWWLVNESTGQQLGVDVTVPTGTELAIDSRNRTAFLAGSPVDYLADGDWPSLTPGPNVFRLVAGTASAGYAQVEALEAYL